MRGILRVALVVGAGFGLGFGNVTTSVAQGATVAHLASPFTAQPRPDGKAHVFRVDGGQFTLDGKPFRIVSGEMHYPRIPREYWRARLRMARAMGLNAITTYAFWNVHEPAPGVYDFSGQNDVAEFIREAQQEGLWVILRPGPYVCAEWEFGGYPAWLLKDPATVVRSSDPKYMEPATKWIKRLGMELAPLQIGNGGPIALVQVENEYGSFGNDHAYMEANQQALVDAGFTKAQLYTADGPGVIANGSLPELPVGINFDGNKPGEAQRSFATLKTVRPEGVKFASEFWAGWFDHWGGPHAHTDAATQTANLKWILEQGYSVSIYMFHGGTNFGWMNGANSSDARPAMYEPDVTSYDYDAALDESGRPTAKYFAFRDVIAKATGVTPPPVPEVAAPIRIAPFKLTEAVPLWDALPKAIESDRPLTMEDVGQNYGWILYRTRLPIGEYDTGKLTIHDYACAYMNHKPVVTDVPYAKITTSRLAVGSEPCRAVDRRLGSTTEQQTGGGVNSADHVESGSDTGPSESWWDLLVENTGRINYSHQLRGDRKGVVAFTPAVHPPTAVKWYVYPLPMDNVEKLKFKKTLCLGPCFYRATFDVDKPEDTFLDTSQLTKGAMWVNGHALGRFWNIGPQKTLYVPGPWLKQGMNEVVVFDVDGKVGERLEGLVKAELGQ
jgi:beta-galactosidase